MRLIGRTGRIAAALLAVGASASAAQLLPPIGVVNDVGRTVVDSVADVGDRIDGMVPDARELVRTRLARLRAAVRANSDLLEMTDLGPAVRGEIIVADPDSATLEAARAAGFTIVAEERVEGLDMVSVTLRPPHGLSVDKGLARLRRIAPGSEFSANHLHFPSGRAPKIQLAAASAGLAGNGRSSAPIGIIDGGIAAHPALRGSAEQRGFARGAPRASAHATAIASLAVGNGPVRGAAPGSPILVADVYGTDPAGGSALALARALGWMAQRRVPVVAISLVGPANSLLGKAIAQARARGMLIVAAVGNDGPSAPPAFPASYPGVIAVTAVDGRNRVLPEAGRASHLDYSAPGADMAAAAAGGRLSAVRGTSYAVPLVAGRLARAVGRGPSPTGILNGEAQDLGPPGPDRRYGRGLVCGACRTPLPKK